jgi:hypothetical protein
MPIEFDCSQCGKHYEVSSSLAGKRGKCKQCGQTMNIPMPAAKPRESTPPVDLYGLDEEPAPLPPRGVVRASVESSEPESPIKPKQKKKKSGGLFAKGKSSADGGSGKGVFAAFGGGVGGLVFIVAFVLRLNGGLFGIATSYQYDKFVTGIIADFNELNAIFRTIQDAQGAQSAAPRATTVFQRMVDRFKANKDKKALQKDIDSINKKYEAELNTAVEEWGSEGQRVGSIPGASDALQGLRAPLAELEALMQSGSFGASPLQPGLRPPAMPPPPRFTPPPHFGRHPAPSQGPTSASPGMAPSATPSPPGSGFPQPPPSSFPQPPNSGFPQPPPAS